MLRSSSRIGKIGTSVALVAAVALVASACGSSNGSATGSSGSNSSSGATSGAAGTAAAGNTLSVSASDACKAAVSEEGGQLNYWARTDPDVFTKEIEPFVKAHPDIKISYTSLRPVDITQRLISEKQANHAYDADGIAGDLPSFAPLFDQGIVQDVDWTKLGIAKDLEFKLNGITAYRIYREVLGLGYNTTKLKASDLPSTWAELVDSKWAGKVIVDPRGVFLSGLAIAWGKDKTISWFKDLMATAKPQIVKGATASMEKIISGEALLTTSSHDAEAIEQQSKGAPVDIKYLDVVPTQDYYGLILDGAKHPNAAACFFSWWGSADGQAQQLKYEFKEDLTQPKGLPSSAKLVAINDTKEADLATDVATELGNLMQGS